MHVVTYRAWTAKSKNGNIFLAYGSGCYSWPNF